MLPIWRRDSVILWPWTSSTMRGWISRSRPMKNSPQRVARSAMVSVPQRAAAASWEKPASSVELRKTTRTMKRITMNRAVVIMMPMPARTTARWRRLATKTEATRRITARMGSTMNSLLRPLIRLAIVSRPLTWARGTKPLASTGKRSSETVMPRSSNLSSRRVESPLRSSWMTPSSPNCTLPVPLRKPTRVEWRPSRAFSQMASN